MVCQFGLPVRGVSPYGSALLSALSNCEGFTIEPVDYRSAYPSAMHPAGGTGSAEGGELHWADPRSWFRVAHREADIVHIQHWMAPLASYLWPLVAMSRRAAKRVVITVHNPEPHESMRAFDALEYRLLSAANVLIVHDARGEQTLRRRMAGRPCDIRIIPHGISTENRMPRQAADYERVGLSPDRRYVLLFGNLRQYKGLGILLESWRNIVERVPDVDLIVAGRLWKGGRGVLARLSAALMGSRRHAEKITDQLGSFGSSSRVILREGFISDDEIDSLLRISEMAVFPYEKFTSQSGAACRAAGSGCPVLVTDTGGLPDLAISRDWVLAPGSVESLTSGLLDRLSFGRIRDKFGADQLERVADYRWETVSRMHLAVYRDLLQIHA